MTRWLDSTRPPRVPHRLPGRNAQPGAIKTFDDFFVKTLSRRTRGDLLGQLMAGARLGSSFFVEHYVVAGLTAGSVRN